MLLQLEKLMIMSRGHESTDGTKIFRIENKANEKIYTSSDIIHLYMHICVNKNKITNARFQMKNILVC